MTGILQDSPSVILAVIAAELAAAFHEYVVRLLSERLVGANRLIEAMVK